MIQSFKLYRAHCALKHHVHLQHEAFVMSGWYDTLSCHVFKCMFLGIRQSPTSAVSWVAECTVCLSSFLTRMEKHMAAGSVHISLCWICRWHWHFISAGMSCVQTLRANVAVCNRRRFEDALNTCQDISLLFLLAILTKNSNTRNPVEAHTAAPQLKNSSAVHFFKREEQSPSYWKIHICLPGG